MSDKAAGQALGTALGGAREAVAARKRIELFPSDYEVDNSLPDAVRLIFRCDAPYERYDLLIDPDAAKKLGAKLLAPRLEHGSPIIDIR